VTRDDESPPEIVRVSAVTHALRTFHPKLAAAIREKLAPIEEGSKVAGWLVWAEAYAEGIDPLVTNSSNGA
jgi:hypothetical protein